MKAFYVLACAALALGAAASFVLVKRPRHAAPPSAIHSLETAITSVADPETEANRPQTRPSEPAPRTESQTRPAPLETGSDSAKNAGERAKSPDPAPQNVPATGGMIVVRDPESGGFVAPTPQQIRGLMGAAPEAVSHSDVGLVERIGPGGAVGVDLMGRFQEYATITIGPGGKKHFGCVNGDAMKGAARDSLPMPQPLEEQ